MMRAPLHRQSGITLLVSLVMLVMITLFVVSMIRLSNSNLRVVGNMQSQRTMEANAQQAIEQKISTVTFFNDAVNSTGEFASSSTTAVTVTVNGFDVSVKKPVCVGTQTVEGYDLSDAQAPEDDVYEIQATASDSVTGAAIEVVQGVRIRTVKGSCV